MRANVRAFVQLAAEALELGGPVYEFGAYQVEGQEPIADLRPFFAGQAYVGCDLRPGPGVDRLEDLAALSLSDGSASTIICVETLEHVFEARRGVEEMMRVLAPGGTLLVAAPLDFRIHDYPGDYWRLTPSCLERLLAPLEATLVGWQGVDRFPHTVFGIGCKAPARPNIAAGLNRFMEAYQRWLTLSASEVPWPRRMKNWLSGIAGSKGDRRRDREYYQVRFAMELPAARQRKHDLLGLSQADSGTGARLDLS
ncbi:MAG: methyltransferase domain-containing protein [Pirellulales bacterium]